mgnify:CR=1 FL=1
MTVPDYLSPFLVGVAELTATVLLIWAGIRLTDRLLPEDNGKDEHHHRFKRQLIKMLVTATGLLVLIIVLPVSDTLRGQLLSLLGLVLTAMIALGSTSFVSNAMAGIMLRSVNNFRPGDFVKVGDHAGRVSERGLFHTEIQTEDRDLTTLPNLYLVQQPVTVIRASGTFISASVSLGYDVPHETAKAKLLEATERADLEEGLVRISDLLDHAVQYRVYGFLTDTKKVLLARSRLRENILNVLHEANIEITSPSHMFQRRLEDADKAIPETVVQSPTARPQEDSKEELIFDKATQAEKTETLRARRDELKQELQDNKDGDKSKRLERDIEHLDRLLEARATQKKEER